MNPNGPTLDPAAHALVGGVIALYAGIILVALVGTIFWIVELIDAIRREYPDPNMKIVWALVIFFLHFLGALIYYFAGKPQGRLPGEAR